MVRLYTIKTFGLTADATWDNIPITFWTTLETTTAMLCTCLPTIRAGLLRLFPQVFATTTHTSTVTTAGTKPVIIYQKSFAICSMPKSWPSRKLTSVSSLSVRDDERRSPTNHSERMQDLEMAKLKCKRFGREWSCILKVSYGYYHLQAGVMIMISFFWRRLASVDFLYVEDVNCFVQYSRIALHSLI